MSSMEKSSLDSLGTGFDQGVLDVLQAASSFLLAEASQGAKEVATVGVVGNTGPRVLASMADELGNEVRIFDGPQKIGDLAKVGVGVELLEVCLGESDGICAILRVWSVQDEVLASPDSFQNDDRFLGFGFPMIDSEFIPPHQRAARFVDEFYGDFDGGCPSGRQASKGGQPFTVAGDGILQASTVFDDIS